MKNSGRWIIVNKRYKPLPNGGGRGQRNGTFCLDRIKGTCHWSWSSYRSLVRNIGPGCFFLSIPLKTCLSLRI